jgi:hypothetical protein
MNLLFVGQPTDKPITAMATNGNRKVIYCATENYIIGYKRGKEVSKENNKQNILVFIFCYDRFHVWVVVMDHTLFSRF